MVFLPLVFRIEGCMLNHVAVAVWFGVWRFDVSKLAAGVAHGQQQNERKPKIIYNPLETNETILRFHGGANRSVPSRDQLTRARATCVA